jgi:hypothetical protein
MRDALFSAQSPSERGDGDCARSQGTPKPFGSIRSATSTGGFYWTVASTGDVPLRGVRKPYPASASQLVAL